MRKSDVLFGIIVFIMLFVIVSPTGDFYGNTILDDTSIIQPKGDDSVVLSAGPNWLTGWTYRKMIKVDGHTGAGTDYQIRLDIEYGSGTDSGDTIYCTSHCQTDFGDIRFTDDDGETELDYWIEEKTDSGDATFWVEVADDLGTNQDIWLYYGTAGASTTTSNGTATFIMFEDWADENADNWETTTGTHGTPDAATWDDTYQGGADSGSVLKLQGGAANAGAGWIWNVSGGFSLTTAHGFIGRIYAEETAAAWQRIYISTGYTSAGPLAEFESREGVEAFNGVDDDDNTDAQAMDNAWCDAWTTFYITRDGTNARLYWDGGNAAWALEETASCEPDTEETVNGPYIYCRDEEFDLYVDWLAVKKFQTLEPDVLTTGPEVTSYSSSWLIGWQYRQRFAVAADADVGEADFAIDIIVNYDATGLIGEVNCSSHCQTDFDDIRFTIDDGVTELEYWREEYTDSDDATFWVEYPLPAIGVEHGYMYYGCAGVSTGSDGYEVFYFFDDFETNDLTDYWTTIDDDWSVSNTVYKYGSYAAYGDSGTGGAGRSLAEDTDIDETDWADGSIDLMFHTWFRTQSVAGDSYHSYAGDSDASVYVSLVNTNDWVTYTTVTGVKTYAANCFVVDTWYRLEVAVSFSNGNFYPYLDRVSKTSQALTDRNNNAVDLIDRTTLYVDPVANRDAWFDDYYIRPWGGVVESTLYGWEDEESSGPVNDVAASCTNIDDTDNLYAYYKEYTFSSSVTDVNGYADIEYVELSLWTGAAAFWTVKYDQDTDTFSESLDANNYITLETGSCTNTSSGVNLDLIFAVTIHWNHTDVTDYDLRQYVIDGDALAATDDYNVNYDVETRLDYSVASNVDDNKGTVDRGDIDGTFYTSGTLIYYGSGDDNPPTDHVDVWVSMSAYGTNVGPWSDTSLSSGVFNVTCYGDDAVGEDTVTVKPVDEDAGSGGTSLYYDAGGGGDVTDTYISDQIQVQGYAVTGGDQRINVGSDSAITVYLQYANDSLSASTGTMTLNGIPLTNAGGGSSTWFTANQQEANPTKNDYDTVACAGDDTHGLTSVDQNGKSTYVIWDRIIVMGYTSNTTDQWIDTSEVANVEVWLQYEYDSTNLTDGTVSINGQAFTYISGGNWSRNHTAAVSLVTFDTVAVSGNTYSITVENQNGKAIEIVFDEVVVSFAGPTDNRQNLDANATGIVVTLTLSYNGTAHGGTATLNDTDFVGDSIVEIAYFTVSSVDGGTYGITTIGTNDNTYMIWDQIKVLGFTSNSTDGRDNIGDSFLVTVWIQYDYDDTNVTDGTIVINGDSFAFGGDSGNWTAIFSNVTVSMAEWNTTVAAGNTYGITDVNDNSKEFIAIWDSLTCYVSPPTDQRIDIGANASGMVIWAIYNYDSAAFDGTLTLNDTTYDYGVVGNYTYNVTIANQDDTYNITIITNAGNQTYCIFDALVCYVSPPTDQRISINANASGMEIWAVYYYNLGENYDGTLELNDTTYNHGTVGIYYYNVTVANGDDTHGITVISNNGNYTYCIFDRVQVTGYTVTDSRDNVGDSISVNVTLIFDYDDSDVTNGTVVINGETFSYNGTGGIWDATFQNATVSDATFDTIVVGANDYIITATDDNGQTQTIIWDQIEVYNSWAGDTRASYGGTVTIRFYLRLEYDDHKLNDGLDSVSINGTGGACIGDYFYRLVSESAVGSYNFVVTAASENTYGITALNATSLTEFDLDIIWDRTLWQAITAVNTTQDYGADGYRVSAGEYVNITIQVFYEYDNTDVTDGTITMNGESMTHRADGYWYIVVMNSTSALGQDYTFNEIATNGNTYSITVANQNSMTLTVIWDQIVVYSDGYDYAFTRVNVGQNVTIWALANLTYDGHDLNDVNDYLEFGSERMTWNGTYFTASYTRWSVANWNFTLNTTDSYEDTYGITVGTNTPVNITFDRILIYDMWTNETYINPGDPVRVWGSFVSEFDNESMQAGVIQVNGTLGTLISGDYNMTFDATSNWYRDYAALGVGNWTFLVTAANWTTYNITEINYNGWNVTYLSVLWDQIIVQMYVTNSTDNWDNINTVVNVTVWLEYSDGTNVTDGTVSINGEALAYLVAGNWTALFSNATASRAYWNSVACAGNTRGITNVDQNSQSLEYVWDSAVITITVGDNRINIGLNCTMNVVAMGAYNNTPLLSTFTMNETTYLFNLAVRHNFTVSSISGGTYGITAISSNDEDYVIWDGFLIHMYSDDSRVGLGDNVRVWAAITYAYLNQSFSSANGTVALNGSAMTFSSGCLWYRDVSQTSVGKYVYSISALTDTSQDLSFYILGMEFEDDAAATFHQWDVDGRLNITTFTIIMRFYPVEVTGGAYLFLLQPNVLNAANLSLYLEDDVTDNLYFISGTTSETYINITLTSDFSSYYDQWNIIVVSVDGTVLNVWLNGERLITDTNMGRLSYMETDPTELVIYGKNQNPWDEGMEGFVSEVFFLNTSLGVNNGFMASLRCYNFTANDCELIATMLGYNTSAQVQFDGWADFSSNDYTGETSDLIMTTSGVLTDDFFVSPVWDGLICYVSPPTDQRQDLNANATGMIIWANYSYDSTVYDGTLSLNNTDYNGDGTVVRWNYNVTVANGDDTYSISVIASSNATYMIWDQILVLGYNTNSTDNRDNINTIVNVTVWIYYDYDSTNVTDGTIVINGDSFAYIGSGGNWSALFSNATVSDATWNTVVCAGNFYGITSVNQNGQSLTYIWDQILVLGYGTNSTDDRDDIGTVVNVTVWVYYDYDNANVTDGTIVINGDSFAYIGSGGNWSALFSNATTSDATWNTVVASGNTWGITSVNQNGKSYTYIWDQIILTVAVNQTWTVCTYYVNVSYSGIYEYDSVVWSGNATIANTSLLITTDVNYEELTQTTVGNWTFYGTAVVDGSYVLTAFDTTTVWCVWDNVTGSVIISPGAEIGGNIPFTIFCYNLTWEYNGSYVDTGWDFEHIDNGTLSNTVDSDGSGFLTPPMWIIVQPATDLAWNYSSNATATLGDGRTFDFQWYEEVDVLVAESFAITSPVYSESNEEWVLSAYANKDFNYIVYENDTERASGNKLEGSFRISYPKNLTVGLWRWAINASDGTDTLWINGSYTVGDTASTYSWIYLNLYGPDAIGIDPLLFKIYVNDTRIWSGNPQFYGLLSATYNITILNFLNETIVMGDYTVSERMIDISLDVYTLFVYSQLDEEFIYFNLTSTAGATWTMYIPPRAYRDVAIYASTNYTYAFTVITGGKGGTFGGTVNIDADYGIIINAYNLMDIYRGIQEVGGGTLTPEEVTAAVLSAYSGPMGQIQFFSWLSAILLFIGLYAVPFVRSRTKKEGGGEIDVAEIMRTGGYVSSKKKEQTPKQLKPFEFPSGPANPKYRGKSGSAKPMDDLSDFVWGRLKGKKSGRK